MCGWFVNDVYSGFLYGAVQAEAQNDFTKMCRDYLDSQ